MLVRNLFIWKKKKKRGVFNYKTLQTEKKMGLGGDGTVRYGKINVEKLINLCVNLKLTYDRYYLPLKKIKNDQYYLSGK